MNKDIDIETGEKINGAIGVLHQRRNIIIMKKANGTGFNVFCL